MVPRNGERVKSRPFKNVCFFRDRAQKCCVTQGVVLRYFRYTCYQSTDFPKYLFRAKKLEPFVIVDVS